MRRTCFAEKYFLRVLIGIREFVFSTSLCISVQKEPIWYGNLHLKLQNFVQDEQYTDISAPITQIFL